MTVRYATGPVTWGVDFADSPGNPPWESVLDDIEASGIGALELGPVGYLPEDVDVLRGALRGRGLTAVGSFVFDNLHDASEWKRIEAVTERACRSIRAAGGKVLVIIDQPSEHRVQHAGRSETAPRLDDGRRATLLETVERMSEMARSYGLLPTVHPHAGGYIEFEDELEWLADVSSADFCMDTGHLAYAGMDPEKIIRRYAKRTAHVHLKDVRHEVLARVRDQALGFWDAVADQVFCPLGNGVVKVERVLRALDAIHYDGYATIEQDRLPGAGCPPLDDLRASLIVLRRAAAGRSDERD